MLTYVCVCVLNCFSSIWLFVTPWTIARQAPLSMGFSRQKYWSGLGIFLEWSGDLPDPGIKPTSLMSPALEGGCFIMSATWENLLIYRWYLYLFVGLTFICSPLLKTNYAVSPQYTHTKTNIFTGLQVPQNAFPHPSLRSHVLRMCAKLLQSCTAL